MLSFSVKLPFRGHQNRPSNKSYCNFSIWTDFGDSHIEFMQITVRLSSCYTGKRWIWHLRYLTNTNPSKKLIVPTISGYRRLTTGIFEIRTLTVWCPACFSAAHHNTKLFVSLKPKCQSEGTYNKYNRASPSVENTYHVIFHITCIHLTTGHDLATTKLQLFKVVPFSKSIFINNSKNPDKTKNNKKNSLALVLFHCLFIVF